MGLLKKLFQKWKSFALKVSKVQTIIVLSLIYFLVIGPSSLILFLLGKDFLRLRSKSESSFWVEREKSAEKDLKRALRQF